MKNSNFQNDGIRGGGGGGGGEGIFLLLRGLE